MRDLSGERCVAAVMIALAFLLWLTVPTSAQKNEMAEIQALWAACENVRAEAADGWIGWRRDFLDGYGDNFAFWNNRGTEKPSVLVVETMIDAVAFVTDTSCYRPDGSLAFIVSVMTSQNVKEGEHKFIKREGRMYFDQSGQAIRVVGWIADATSGKELGQLDDTRFELARGCLPVVLHRTVDQVELHYFSELGDHYGEKPPYAEQQLHWCSLAKPE